MENKAPHTLNPQDARTIKIGIFDSGLGGLGVYKELQKQLALKEAREGAHHHDIRTYYISDLAFCPYGEKTQEQIIARSRELAEMLMAQGAQLLVVACNTATALAIDQLRQEYSLPFVGVEPYLNFIHHYKTDHRSEIMGHTRPFRPAVLLTKASSQSGRFRHLLHKLHLGDGDCRIFPCEGLAWLIESHIHQLKEPFFRARLEELLAPLRDQGITHAILGCTHYPYVAPLIEEILQVNCVAPEAHVARWILQLLDKLTPREPREASEGEGGHAFGPFPSMARPMPRLKVGVTASDPFLAAKLRTILHELP